MGSSIIERHLADTYTFDAYDIRVKDKDGYENYLVSKSYELYFRYPENNNGTVTILKRKCDITIDISFGKENEEYIYSQVYDGVDHAITNANICFEENNSVTGRGLIESVAFDQVLNIYYLDAYSVNEDDTRTFDYYHGDSVSRRYYNEDGYRFFPVVVQVYNNYLGCDVSNCYEFERIIGNNGYSYITKRPLTITIDTSLGIDDPLTETDEAKEIIYDSYEHNITIGDISYNQGTNIGLVSTDTVSYLYINYSYYNVDVNYHSLNEVLFNRSNVGTYTYVLAGNYSGDQWNIYDDQYHNVNNCYVVTPQYFTYTSVTIKQRPLYLTHNGFVEVEYDGVGHGLSGLLEIDTTQGYALADNDRIDYSRLSYNTVTTPGTHYQEGIGSNNTNVLYHKNFIVRKDSLPIITVADNYDIHVLKASITINKRNVVLTHTEQGAQLEKNFDGYNLENTDGYYFSQIVTLAPGYSLADDSVKDNYRLSGNYIVVEGVTGDYIHMTDGFLPIRFDYHVTINDTYVDINAYYNFTFDEELTYKINRGVLSLVNRSGYKTRTYDGTEYKDYNHLLDLETLPDDYSYSGIVAYLSEPAIEVGDYVIQYNLDNLRVYDNYGNDITSIYDINTDELEPFKIEPRYFEFSTLYPSITFDGEYHNAAEIIGKCSSGLVDGHTLKDNDIVNIKYYDSEGVKAYLFEAITIVDSEGNNVNHLYELRDNTYRDSLLTFRINRFALINPGVETQKVYDGIAVTEDKYVEHGTAGTSRNSIYDEVSSVGDGRFYAVVDYEGSNFVGKSDADQYIKRINIRIYDRENDNENVTNNFRISSYNDIEYINNGDSLYYQLYYIIKKCDVTIYTEATGERTIAYDGKTHMESFVYTSDDAPSGLKYDGIVITSNSVSIPEGLTITVNISGEGCKDINTTTGYHHTIGITVNFRGNEETFTNETRAIDLVNYRIRWSGSNEITTYIRKRDVDVEIYAIRGQGGTTSTYVILEDDEVKMYPEKIVLGGIDKSLAEGHTLYIGEEAYNANKVSYEALNHLTETMDASINYFGLQNDNVIDIREGLQSVKDLYYEDIDIRFSNGVTLLHVIREEDL